MKKKKIIFRLLLEARPIWKSLALGIVLSATSVLCAVATPDLLGQIIQNIYDFSATGSGSLLQQIVPGLAVLLCVYAIGSIMGYLNMLLMNKTVSRHFSCGLRIRISEKIRRLPIRYVDQTPVGDIISRMTGDVSEMGGYMHQIFDILVKGVFQIILIAAIMFAENWQLACIVVLVTPISVFLSIKIAALSEEFFEKRFAQEGRLTELVEESFYNHPTIKAYNLEDYIVEKHRVENRSLQKLTAKSNFMGSLVQPLIRFSNALGYIVIALLGGILIVRQGVPVGVVVAIVLYSRQFASPLEELAYGFGRINQVRAASERVFEILDMPEEENQAGESVNEVKGSVCFDHVDFSYTRDQPLIDDLSFQITPGSKIAIVGPTGAGKTTIVNLLMRFYDPNSGVILLDGIDSKDISREQVRSWFGMVLQDTWLFHGTVLENVSYGRPDATRKEVEQACKKAHCDHFIRTLPNGYDTVIGEDAANLSGGQKQLLTIARVLLANRPLLILDEATSNVDTRTELLIQEAMDELMQNKTCFVIAHRLSTVINADLILVMDQGKIVEQGSHASLLEQKGFYYQLFNSQYAV